MKKILEKVISSANRAGKAIFGNPISKKIASAALAFTIALSPIVPSLVVMADEAKETQEAIEETTVVQAETEVNEVTLPSGTTQPDYSESTTESVIVDDDDIVVVDPTETIDTTAPPTEQETEPSISETTPAVEKKSNIISANENNFADLIADLSSSNRLIVYYNGSLDTEATGVYYDGVYYLSYSSEVIDSASSFSKFCKWALCAKALILRADEVMNANGILIVHTDVHVTFIRSKEAEIAEDAVAKAGFVNQCCLKHISVPVQLA